MLDASALLSVLLDEPGRERVESLVELERTLPVLTADRAWAGLGLPVEVRLIR